MQDGTQTFLEYIININLENKPTNLKFYYDSDKKEEITADGNKITLNGFITWHGSQLRDEIIYWEWPYQTGETEVEIRNNDIDDSSFMDKVMKMRIGVVGRQAKEPTTDMYAEKGVVGRYEAVHNTVDGYNENSTTWYDVSGNGNTGIIHNATFGDNYLEFNGTNSWVNLGYMHNDYMSIEATFMINNYATEVDSGSEKAIICNSEGNGITLHLYLDKLRGAVGVNGWKITPLINVELGKVYNVVLTYNGERECIYINGEKYWENRINGKIAPPLYGTIMAMGMNPCGSSGDGNSMFDGKIYSAAVYNRALTEREVANNAHIALSFANGN